MPRAPSYNPNQVAPAETTSARFRTPDFGPSSVAQGLANLGGAVNDFAVAEEQRNIEFDDTQSRKLATNALTELQGITNEYTSLQGGNATAARKGIDERLAKSRESYLGQAANDRQKRLLGERLDGLFGSAIGTIDKHYRSEEYTERLGTIATESMQFGDSAASTDDADAAAGYLAQGKAVFQEGLRLKGVTDPEAVAFETKKYVDGVHTAKIDRWFASPNPNVELIQSYVEAHHDEFTAAGYSKALERLQGPLQDREDYTLYTAIASGIQSEMPVAPSGVSDPARMHSITAQTESGNKDYSGGRLVTSPKGAQGRMQVMPGTQTDPGFGIRPAANNTPDELARVGRDYLDAMMKRYGGDPAKAWAAYNAGPGAVDKALARGGDWLTKMPKETRDYVGKNVAALGGTDNAPRQHDKTAIYDAIEQRGDITFEQKERLKRVADREIARDEQLLGRERAAADEAAFSTINGLGEGFTSISQLPSSVRAKLSPSDVAKYESIAKSNAAPKPVPANGAAAFTLDAMEMADPNAFAAADLSQYFPELTAAERSSYMLRQQKVKDGLKGWTPYSGINGAVGRAKNFGGYKLDDGQSLAVRQIMQAEADRRFKATGKPLPDTEFDEIFRVATRDVPTHKWYGAKGAVKWYDQTVSTIGDDTVKKIGDAFKKTYGRDPTDDETMAWYRRNFIPARAQ